MRLLWTVAAVALATLLLLTAGCSGDGTLLAELSPGFAGSAVKGPIANAEVKAFHFDPAGTEIEITAINAPVYTDAAGSFEFRVAPGEMALVTSPIIVRTMGGTMFGRAAPTLEGVIPDPEALTYGQVTLDCQLSTASCVAAGLLRKQAAEQGAAPQPHDADQIFALVESELGVDLSECPADAQTCVARVNHCVDQNLDLEDQAESAQIVADFVDYLVANLSSSSQELDDSMADPANPASDIPASFVPFGMLATVLPDGPSGFVELAVDSDKPYIGTDGGDVATIRATLTDACGQPVPDAQDLTVTRISGNALVEPMNPPANSNELEILVTASAVGQTVVEVAYALDNGNDLSQQVTVQAVDLLTDTDGDGTPDGLETIGWTVVVDGSGYGDAARGALLEVRHVTSDANLADTDGDGLNDHLEYLIRSDPRSADTDGDGLTDHAEWTQWITNPNSVDTDADSRGPGRNDTPNAALFDGNELTMLHTSPTLPDTDGDGKTDYEEADHPTRSPLIANLPKLEIEIVDEIDVRLDVEYAEEEGKTSQYGTEFSQSQTETETQSHSATVGASLMVGAELQVNSPSGLPPTPSASATFKTELTLSTSYTYTNTRESSRTSQQSYSEYTTDARTRTETAASGSMSIGIRLQNTGQITYTVTQLGLTARQWVPVSQSFRTLATLTPALQGGFTLAPGAQSPVLQLEAKDLNASRIKDYLAKPDSLHFESAYYELENAEGLNFAYLEEVTGPQTARILIDYGNGTTEEYRVATNVEREVDGGWAGISMSRILGDVLAIPYGTLPRSDLAGGTDTTLVLDSVRGVATYRDDSLPNPSKGFWLVVIGTDTDEAPVEGEDFQDFRVYGGDSILLAYMYDEDGDYLWSSEEQHYRTGVCSGEDDSDDDNLSDRDEIRGATFNGSPCGWTVKVYGAAEYPVVSDPASADQDQDGLTDYQEKNSTYPTDPTRPDTDNDGLRDDVDPFPLHPAKILRVKAGSSAQDADGSSWTVAYPKLQDALEAAKEANTDGLKENDVSEIWVAAGIYTPTEAVSGDGSKVRYVPFDLLPGVSLYGGFAGVPEETKQTHRDPSPYSNGTELSGDLDGDDDPADSASRENNAYHVVRVDETVDHDSIMDGFSITGGYAEHGDGDNDVGGGMYIEGNVTLRNLLFRDNYARGVAGTGAGGAAVFFVPSEDVTDVTTSLANCIFSRNESNHSGGAVYYDGSAQAGSLRITDCQFQQNKSGFQGGAIWAEGDIQVTRSRFASNRVGSQGGGLFLGGGIASISDCLVSGNFTENDQGGGVFVAPDGQVVLRQCAISSNYASEGAGVYVYQGGLTLYHCTVTGNQARVDDGGGGLYFFSASGRIENSIIWGNDANSADDLSREIAAVNKWNFPHISLRNSCVRSWKEVLDLEVHTNWWGNGNIGDNPNLDGLQLKNTSPCIDRGDNYLDYDPLASGFQPLPEMDLAGKWRIVDGNHDGDAVVDMGAYENQGN